MPRIIKPGINPRPHYVGMAAAMLFMKDNHTRLVFQPQHFLGLLKGCFKCMQGRIRALRRIEAQ